MEAAGCEGEWSSSFTGVSSDEADFMAQLLGSSSLPSTAVWGGNGKDFGVEERSVSPSDETNTSIFSFSQPSSFHESYYPYVNTRIDLCMMDGKSNAMGGYGFLNQEASNESVELDMNLSQPLQEQDPCEVSKKRLAESQRSKKLKKRVKVDDETDDNAVVLHRQSSSCCSDDASNGVNSNSSSKRSGAQNSNSKARASRGSATDPQSLYARKRRERINERLKILQHLVPNGTKVDISTMLEEAVEYVKFLQLQIKLLSSDDMWMYAPIAYNGMDLGLDFKIPSPKPQS